MAIDKGWSSTAYLTCVEKTYNSITVELSGLTTNYNGERRTIDYYVNGHLHPGSTVQIDNGISSHVWTISNLEPDTPYTIYARATYEESPGVWALIRIGEEDKEDGIKVTTYSANFDYYGYAIDANATAKEITVSLHYDGWRYDDTVSWYIGTSENDLFNDSNKKIAEATYSLEYKLSGLIGATTYYVGVMVYEAGSPVLEYSDYIAITTLTDSPSISFVSIKRTLTELTVVLRNTSSIEQQYTIMTSDALDEKGYDMGSDYFAPYETKTFTKSTSGDPLFVWIWGGDISNDWYYPKSKTTVRAEDGNKFKPLKSTAGYSSYYIKVDITQDFPWDESYEIHTESPYTMLDFCWTQYNGNSNSILNGHENIYQSTNYNLHSTTASMIIEMDLKYPCKISFNYANNGHYGYNPDNADYFYEEELRVIFDDTTTKAYNKNRDGAWVNYTVECAAGKHTLTLKYIKDEKYNRYLDRAFFADFKITPCIPEKWDWSASNGNASDEQTQKSYTAIKNRGRTSVFSYLVWNDMVNKVKHILDYISGDYNSGDWNTKYGCDYENTLMVDTKPGRTLTAKRFNSLRQNIDDIESTNIGEVYSENPNYPVYGWYFTKLMQCVNTYIENNINV